MFKVAVHILLIYTRWIWTFALKCSRGFSLGKLLHIPAQCYFMLCGLCLRWTHRFVRLDVTSISIIEIKLLCILFYGSHTHKNRQANATVHFPLYIAFSIRQCVFANFSAPHGGLIGLWYRTTAVNLLFTVCLFIARLIYVNNRFGFCVRVMRSLH